MKFTLISDVHAEFLSVPKIDSFVNNLVNNNKQDLLVIAGDLCAYIHPNWEYIATKLSDSFEKVLYVLGNHELYGYKGTKDECIDEMCSKVPYNFHILDNQTLNINGIIFGGTPLWFRDTPAARKNTNKIPDFRYINNYENWVYKENIKAIEFIENNRNIDVLITHHLPSSRSTSLIYKDSATNCYFVCDIEELLQKNLPRYSVHGHIHTSCNYMVNEFTQVVCNPLGYPNELSTFKEQLVLTI